MMDGPVLWCFAAVLVPSDRKSLKKLSDGLSLRSGGVVFSWVECRTCRSLHPLRSLVIPVLVLFVIPGLPSPSFPARPGISQLFRLDSPLYAECRSY